MSRRIQLVERTVADVAPAARPRDVLDVPVERPMVSETVSLGAPLSQIAVGRCPMGMTTNQLDDKTTADRTRRAAARVPLDLPTGLLGRLVAWYSRRTYGDVLDNGLALLHNKPVLFGVMGLERKVAKWHRLDADLKTLAVMASAATIGCTWCTDFGYYAAHSEGLDVSKLREVPRWRESEVFGDVERRVIEYAEAMTATPTQVTDDMADVLREDLGVDAFVELTMMVAIENERSRFNSALGLTSQGFSDRCDLPTG